MANQDKGLPRLILNYLHKERENILQGGIDDAFPWLVTLYNIRRIYPNADFSITGLGFYLRTFEHIVPKEIIEKYKSINWGDSTKLKNYLKKSLSKLKETRHKPDIVYDNEMVLVISNRLIEDSFEKKDVEAILLAMKVKSDFSLNFQSKETGEVTLFKVPTHKSGYLDNIYSHRQQLIKDLFVNESELLSWLAVTEGKVFQLSLEKGEFQYHHLKNWNWDKFNELRKLDYFSALSFDETIKEKSGVRMIFSDEHREQAMKIAGNLDFCTLELVHDVNSILIVKDMQLAKFPHNLFLDDNGEFIYLEKPIANILSTDWYLTNKNDISIDCDYTKSIWIPIDQGDFTLNLLYNSLEQYLVNYQFEVFTQLPLPSPIKSKLNIVCSHGFKNIASVQVLSPRENFLVSPEQVVGKGDILVFFVCHSGSYQNELLRNDITSIVKNYISLGYRAVVAPFWSLHVNIPEIWLPEFLSSLNNGLSLNFSVYNANKAVSVKYPTPSAWACMHLYGNPHLKVCLEREQ